MAEQLQNSLNQAGFRNGSLVQNADETWQQFRSQQLISWQKTGTSSFWRHCHQNLGKDKRTLQLPSPNASSSKARGGSTYVKLSLQLDQVSFTRIAVVLSACRDNSFHARNCFHGNAWKMKSPCCSVRFSLCRICRIWFPFYKQDPTDIYGDGGETWGQQNSSRMWGEQIYWPWSKVKNQICQWPYKNVSGNRLDLHLFSRLDRRKRWHKRYCLVFIPISWETIHKPLCFLQQQTQFASCFEFAPKTTSNIFPTSSELKFGSIGHLHVPWMFRTLATSDFKDFDHWYKYSIFISTNKAKSLVFSYFGNMCRSHERHQLLSVAKQVEKRPYRLSVVLVAAKSESRFYWTKFK